MPIPLRSHRTTVAAAAAARATPGRLVFVVAGSLIALAGLVGTTQLLTGTFTPPVSDLSPLGLSSWTLPGLWLFVSVVMPWSAAARSAWRRGPTAPTLVLLACAALLFELVVQIPFLGFSLFQPIMGTAALGLGFAALRTRAAWSR